MTIGFPKKALLRGAFLFAGLLLAAASAAGGPPAGERVLAHVSHHPSTADTDLLAGTGRTPSSRFDVVSTTPSPSSGPCTPSQRHLDALATNDGEKCGLVKQVLDGDSLVLADGRHVRLIGINAPERGRDEEPDQPLAQEARALLAGLTVNVRVHLVFGPERFDRYGRTLAHVYGPDRKSVQEILLAQGLAVVVAIPPNLQRLDAYQSAETKARQRRAGIWGHPYYRPLPAEQLQENLTGFHFVTGHVQRVGKSQQYIYFDLTKKFSVVIPQEHWHRFGGTPERFHNKAVLARGWVTVYKNKLRIRLAHPAMIEIDED